jgi:hypothetical protein
MAFNDTITSLTSTSTFYDWYLKENNEIISKLNQVKVSGITNGDGIVAGLCASSGLVTISIGGTLGVVQTGLTFAGDISFLQNVIIPNNSYKITGITSGSTGYTFGSVVRITTSGYTLAKADSADSAEVIGFISSMKSTHSVITTSGKIEGNFTSVAGSTLSPGCVYFLDAVTAGTISTTEPTTMGQVSKPVMIGLGETAGLVVQYRGNYLNASSGAGSGSGSTGTNKIILSFLKTQSTNTLGFTFGSFLSYAPQLVSGSTFFNKVLVDSGRTAINGWFLSGSKNYIYRTYDVGTEYWNLPDEEDFIVGMIESSSSGSSNIIYTLITRGTSTVIPKAISSAGTKQGPWCISGATYTTTAIGATGQLQIAPTNINSLYPPKYQVGFVFDSSPSYWFINPRPLVGSAVTSAFRTTQSPETLTNGFNYAFNGDFSIWQRDTGKTSYTTYGSVYFADNWIRRQSLFADETTPVQNLERKSFASASTDVEGNPEYYIDLKCLENPVGLGSSPAAAEYSVGHVIDDIETFNGSNITVSFYAKCTLPNYSANVYFARYSGGSQISKQTIGTINLQTSWTKHTMNYDVPSLSAASYTNDYVEIGIDLIPLITLAYNNIVTVGTNLTVSLASFVVYDGTYTSPPHQFQQYTDKLKKSQRYYNKTYKDSQSFGTKTMLTTTEPELNTFNFTYLPNSPFGIFKFPTLMRTTPTVSVYSPLSGLSNEMYNYTAGKDLRNTTGTVGYNNTRRYATPNTTTVSTTSDPTTTRVNIVTGAVPYDVINCHLIVDASYPI